MKKLFLFTGLIFIFVAFTNAQGVKRSMNLTPAVVKSMNNNSVVTAKRHCGTMEHLQWMYQQDPTLEARMKAEEKRFNEYIETHRTELEKSKTNYTMPVVIHCVYNGTSGKITQTQATEQIAQTNKDWGGTNGRSMEQFASSLRAASGITLCLATKDPSGNATTGIDWKTTTVSSFGTNDAVKKTANGGAAAWDPTKYLNIWVCNLGSSLCGYAQFPSSGINSTYGVVIHYQFFGITGASSPYNGGGTVSHEFGHCFALYHTWGDEDACAADDGCTDTPKQATATYGNHSGCLTDACSTACPGIMYMNFMDYSDDADYANMTPQQVTKMQTAVSTYLTSVANYYTTACGGGAAPVAAFTGNPTAVSTGGTVAFTDQSTNAPTTWAWTFTGGTPASSTAQNPSIVYNTAGTYQVVLTASNASGSNTCTKASYITVTTPSSAPVAAFTANVTTINTGGSVTFTDQSTNSPTTWAWTFGDGGTSTVKSPSHTYNTAGTYNVALTATNSVGSNTCTKTAYIKVDAPAAGCDTLWPATFVGTCLDSLTLYVPDGIAPYDSGYITGQCAYKWKELAQKYKITTSNTTVQDVIVMYALKAGTTGNTSMKLYPNNGGTPGTVIATSATKAKSAIDTTNYGINYNNVYHFTTAQAVTLNSYYFFSVTLPTTFTTGTDELAIWGENIECSAADSAGSLLYGTTWYTFVGAFGVNIDMAILPIACVTVGVTDIDLNNDLHVYPNPANGQFTIDFSGTEQKNVEVEIYDMMGNLLKSAKAQRTDKMVLDVNDQSSGFYIVNVKTDKGRVIRKLTILK